jgi:hypothetical protein
MGRLEHFGSIILRVAWVGLVVFSPIGGNCLVGAPNAAEAGRSAFRQQAQAEGSPERRRQDAIGLGEQQRTGRDEIAVAVEFVASDQALPIRIRTEIELAEGPWRFQKAEAPRGSSHKVTVRQRTEERETPEGKKERARVLSLVVSAPRRAIPAGTIGVLRFELDQAGNTEPIPLTVREWEISRRENQSPRHQPMLEPPSGDSGMDPVAGCFFFAH